LIAKHLHDQAVRGHQSQPSGLFSITGGLQAQPDRNLQRQIHDEGWRLTKARSELQYDININAQVLFQFAPAANDSFRAWSTFGLTRMC
jgi:hypothetical protein